MSNRGHVLVLVADVELFDHKPSSTMKVQGFIATIRSVVYTCMNIYSVQSVSMSQTLVFRVYIGQRSDNQC